MLNQICSNRGWFKSPMIILTFWRASSRHILSPRWWGGKCRQLTGWYRRNFVLVWCNNYNACTLTIEPGKLKWKTGKPVSLTVDSQSDRQACHSAHRILHCAAVDVIICHQHPCDSQEFVVRGEQQPCRIGQWLSSFEPPVYGPGSIFMGAVEDDVFAELQYWRGLHVDIGPGYSLWIQVTADTIVFNM